MLEDLTFKSLGVVNYHETLDLMKSHIQQADFIKGVCNVPTHFIAGGDSNYITTEDKITINTHFLDSSITTIDGAGHWLHAEKPEKFYTEVMRLCLI